MCRLLESIKYNNGKLHNLSYHEARMHHAMLKVYGKKRKINLAQKIHIPKNLGKGLYKCRIVYDTEILKVEFSLYKRK